MKNLLNEQLDAAEEGGNEYEISYAEQACELWHQMSDNCKRNPAIASVWLSWKTGYIFDEVEHLDVLGSLEKSYLATILDQLVAERANQQISWPREASDDCK